MSKISITTRIFYVAHARPWRQRRIVGSFGQMARVKNAELNAMFLQMRKRAERYSSEQLVNTFVNAGLLLEVLSNEDHQIVYGRRGTGKTHAFSYLADQIANKDDIPIYIDISRLGSDTSIYNDLNLSISERAIRLLRDVLNDLHDQLLELITFTPGVNLGRFSDLIDAFGRAMPMVELQGSSEAEATDIVGSDGKIAVSVTGSRSPSANMSYERSNKLSHTVRQKDSGTKRYTVRFWM